MTKDTAASVKARLLAMSRADGSEFERTLVRFANERLLFRLGASSAADRVVLKGASLLAVWLPDPNRSTRDVDLLAYGKSEADDIRAMIEQACALPCPEDGLRFDTDGMIVETIKAQDEYAGKRARFLAHLGKARIAVQVDVGTGDAVDPNREVTELPILLEGLPAPRLRAYRPEETVAEKFDAMVELDTHNSRMKDFHDVWALSQTLPFEGPTLRGSVEACFARRRSPWSAEIPRALTATFYQLPELEARWKAYVAGGAVLVPPPARFGEIGEAVTRFLQPLRDAMVEGDSFELDWPPGGPWRRPADAPVDGDGNV